MKILKKLVFLTFIITASSCSKDNLSDAISNPEDEQSNGNNRVAVQAMVDGVEFKAFYSKSRAGINQGSFFVESFTPSEDKLIRLVTDDFQGVGTYSFFKEEIDFNTFAQYVEIDQPSQLNNQEYLSPFEVGVIEGEFTITHLSENNAKGTFNFKATNVITNEVKNITGGAFDTVLYQ